MARAKAKTRKKATTRRKTTAKKRPAARKTTAKRKTAAKKTTARKTAAKKKPAAKKKAVAKKPAAKKLATSAIGTKLTKTQIYRAIAEDTELSTAQIKEVFASLENIVDRHLMKRGAGEVTIPNLSVKIRRVRKPATKARKGRNPFTGEEIMISAKPARNVVRVTALKALKEKADK